MNLSFFLIWRFFLNSLRCSASQNFDNLHCNLHKLNEKKITRVVFRITTSSGYFKNNNKISFFYFILGEPLIFFNLTLFLNSLRCSASHNFDNLHCNLHKLQEKKITRVVLRITKSSGYFKNNNKMSFFYFILGEPLIFFNLMLFLNSLRCSASRDFDNLHWNLHKLHEKKNTRVVLRITTSSGYFKNKNKMSFFYFILGKPFIFFNMTLFFKFTEVQCKSQFWQFTLQFAQTKRKKNYSWGVANNNR